MNIQYPDKDFPENYWLIIGFDGDRAEPVSYTHLDVYKRQIWAPAFSTAALISSREYFPDPSMKRDWNSCPPRQNVSFVKSIIVFLLYKIVFEICFLIDGLRLFRL